MSICNVVQMYTEYLPQFSFWKVGGGGKEGKRKKKREEGIETMPG